jgi:opacity protein-like surface antigen
MKRLALLPVVTVFAARGGAKAADPLGLYIGAAAGQAEVAGNVQNPFVPFAAFPIPTSDTFRANHFAYKFLVGLRPISILGAELSYLDFGNPTGRLFGYPANASMKGESAFGILYLPIPVIDVFAKAGVARIRSTVSGFAPNGSLSLACEIDIPCGAGPVRQNGTKSTFAAGAGVQFKINAWAVRAEYERFSVAGEAPHLVSVGLTWSL